MAPGAPATSSLPAAAAIAAEERSIMPAPPSAPGGPRAPRLRRTAPCGRPRTPGPARGPSPLSPPRRPARLPPRRVRSRGACPAALGPRPASSMISSMIAFGPLRARVVGGHDRPVGEPPGGRPHQCALAAVAVPPAPNTTCTLARVRLRAARSTFSERVGRVGVVHEHAEVLASSTGSSARAHARSPRARSRAPRASAPPRRRRARCARWKEARQRRLDLYSDPAHRR